MIYKFAKGISFKADAQVVGETISDIRERNNGMIQAADLVNEARPKRSPLNGLFEWRNGVAAEKFREEQARRVIRAVRTVFDESSDEPIETVAFVRVRIEGNSGYVSAVQAMTDDELRGQVLAEARAAILGWQKRYRHLGELEMVFSAIDEAMMAAV